MKPTAKIEITIEDLCILCGLLAEDIDRYPLEAIQNPSMCLADKIRLHGFLARVIIKRKQ